MKSTLTILIIAIFLITLFFYFGATMEFIGRKKSCAVWERETGRETKFVSDFPWYADCYTKTESGWISAFKLEQIETPNLK